MYQKKIIAPRGQQYISRLSPIGEIEGKGDEDNAFSGGKRRRKTRKKRGGVERWREKPYSLIQRHLMILVTFTIVNPCRTLDPSNKSKYRENMIITGDRDGNELMLPDEWKIIRMDDSEFYDPQLQLVDMREREGLRGMAAFRRRAQDLCNRGYKPLREMMQRQALVARKRRVRKGVVMKLAMFALYVLKKCRMKKR